MFIQEKNTFQDDNNSTNKISNLNFSYAKAAYPEDIPLIEAYDEDSFNPIDNIYHIEDF
jgi:hypothetical protein